MVDFLGLRATLDLRFLHEPPVVLLLGRGRHFTRDFPKGKRGGARYLEITSPITGQRPLYGTDRFRAGDDVRGEAGGFGALPTTDAAAQPYS